MLIDGTDVANRYNAVTIKDRLVYWLVSCDNSRKAKCDATYRLFKDAPGPARLLEPDSMTTPLLRLGPTRIHQVCKYAAFSYIWGAESHSAMTLKSNLSQKMHCMSMESLPRVYREAIDLCRHCNPTLIGRAAVPA